MAASGTKASGRINPEAELMRFAGDPLLVHRYLTKLMGGDRNTSAERNKFRAAVEDEFTAIAPLATDFPPPLGAAPKEPKRSYHDTGLIFEASREPMPFFASVEDTARAIEGNAQGPGPEPGIPPLVIRAVLLIGGIALAAALGVGWLHSG